MITYQQLKLTQPRGGSCFHTLIWFYRIISTFTVLTLKLITVVFWFSFSQEMQWASTALLMHLTRVWMKLKYCRTQILMTDGLLMWFEKRRHWLNQLHACAKRNTSARLSSLSTRNRSSNESEDTVFYYFNQNTFASMNRCYGDAVRRRALKSCVCFGLVNKLLNLTQSTHLHHVSHHCMKDNLFFFFLATLKA